MNISLAPRRSLPVRRSPAPDVAEATVIALGAALSVIYFDRPGGGRGRLHAEQAGLPIVRPFLAAELALASGGARHVLVVPQAVETVLSRRLLLRLGDTPAAEIDPDWLQLPQEELPALTAQLSMPGLCRLVRILTTGASLFAGSAQDALAHAVAQLMDSGNIAAGTAVARSEIAGRTIVTYSAPRITRQQILGEAVAVSNGRVIRLKNLDCFHERDMLHVLLPAGVSFAPFMAFLDPAPVRLVAADASLRRLPIARWIEGRTEACRDWLLSCMPGGGDTALAQELSGTLIEPKVTVRHLSSTSSGVLHAVTLDDPSRIVRKVILERADHQVELNLVHGVDGTAILVGLADLPGDTQRNGTCRIRVRYESGYERVLLDVPVPAYDGSVPDGFEDAWMQGIDALRPLAQARAACRSASAAFAVQRFGTETRPSLRIVTSVGASADLIRARAAMILAEGTGAPVEVVCTMADGPMARNARHLLAETAAIYGIAHRLVLFPQHAAATSCLHAVLGALQEVPALILDADILPEKAGWLAFWQKRLRKQDALSGAVLATDGSIAATREGEDPCRGLPAANMPLYGRVTDRPLAGCLGLGPGGIARLVQDGSPHPDPALWVAAALGGHARTETRFPFRRFGQAPTPGRFASMLVETGFSLITSART